MSDDLLDVAMAAVGNAAREIRERVASMSDLEVVRFALRVADEVDAPPRVAPAKRGKKPKPAKPVVAEPKKPREKKKREAATSSPRPLIPLQQSILAQLQKEPRKPSELVSLLNSTRMAVGNALQGLKLRSLVKPAKLRGGPWSLAS